jgi:hypothetical protein
MEPQRRRVFNWTAIFVEIEDLEGIARSLNGAVGSIVRPPDLDAGADGHPRYSEQLPLGDQGGLNGSSARLNESSARAGDWPRIGAWIAQLRPPRGPKNLNKVEEGRKVFWEEAKCQGCHAPPLWTVSRLFYEPDDQSEHFDHAYESNGLPESVLPAPAGRRFARSPRPVATKTHDPDNDQIQCVLRNVGTYGVSPDDVGVAEMRGSAFVDRVPGAESQGDAVDGKGYNVPSLFGMSVGAPYFHAGNARTLEEALEAVFGTHRSVFGNPSLFVENPEKIDQLVQYLLSIDLDETGQKYSRYETDDAVGGAICPISLDPEQ